MEKFLAVQVEHSRYVSLFKLDRPHDKELSLTTLVDNQKQADIKVYLIDDGNKIPIHTFSLPNLPRKKSGDLRLVLKASFNGRSSVHFRISLDGRLHDTQRISLRKYLKKSRFRYLLWLIPLLILIAALFFLLLGPGKCSFSRREVGRGAETRQEAGKPEEKTPPVTVPQRVSPSSGQKPEETDETLKEAPVEMKTERAPEPAVTEEPAGAAESGEAEESAITTESAGTAAPAKTAKPVEAEEPAETTKSAGSETVAAVFTLEKQVYFRPDNANLTGEAREMLGEIADILKKHPEAQVGIYGHCALYGTEKGRIELSRQRAEEVDNFLKDRGWQPEKEPEIRALGGNQPVTRNSENQYLNRRVEIIVPPPDSNISSRQDR